MKRSLLVAVPIAAALLLIAFLSAFRYQYVKSGLRTDRVDRFSGQVCTMPCSPPTSGPPPELEEQRAISDVKQNSLADAVVLGNASDPSDPSERYEWQAVQSKAAVVNGSISDDSSYVVCYCKKSGIGFRWEVHVASGELFYMNDNANLSRTYGLTIPSPSPSPSPPIELESDSPVIPQNSPEPSSPDSSKAIKTIQGDWEITESNAKYGVMVWRGQASLEDEGSRIRLDIHKERIGRSLATPCEQNTHLRFALDLSRDAQIGSYDEVNCENAKATGEVRLDQFAQDRQTFSGSFWYGGAQQGDFQGRRLSN